MHGPRQGGAERRLEDRLYDAAEPLVRLTGLVKDYGRHRALDGISLEFRRGVTGLLGPNGAGKSTLIKVLLGLVEVTAGGGTVLGFDLAAGGRRIRANVGYMPEDDCYLPGMSGVEAVRFSACLSGLPHLEGLRRAHEILDFVGAGQERYRDVETYSTGMRQKVKFAQAIVHDPPLLIFDEPTAALDPEEREAMLARIRTLCTKHRKAVIVSTHILPDVRQVCDHVVILAGGRVRLSETLETLTRPAAPGVTVRTDGDASRLVRLLREQGHSIREGDETTFFVEAVDARNASLVWELAAEAEAGVLSMTPVRNSLEEVFMNSVRGGRLADP